MQTVTIHKKPTPYHPQGDGLVGFNRTLLDMLSTNVKDLGRLHKSSYNTSVQPTTGYTPFYLIFGRQAHIPVDVMSGSSPIVDTSPSIYATTLKQSLTTAYNHVHDKMNITF